MENIFVLIYRYFKTHRLVFWSCFVLAFGLPALIASRLHLEEDITSIIPKDEKTRELNEIFQQSKLLDKMILTIKSTDAATTTTDSLVVLADELAEKVNASLGQYVSEVAHQVDEDITFSLFDNIHEHLPVFLEPRDYASIDSLITPEGVKATLERNYRTLTSPAGLALKQFIAKDPSGISSPALKKLQLLQYDQQFELYDNHIITRDGRQLILFITPAYPKNNTGKNAEFLDGLDKVIDSLQLNHPGFTVSYFGGTAVAVGNAVQLRQDTMLTQGITVIFLILFFALYFRRKSAPVLILVPALFGALLSLAAITLIKGSISVIALGTGSIILGIAVNYSLHVFNHHRHRPDMEEVLHDLSHPMTIGSITTIGGFLCLQFVQSEMLRDLGLFAAFSLIGASLASLVFLPQLIRVPNTGSKHREGWLDRLAAYRIESNKKLVWLILALTIFLAFFVKDVGFEPDMNRMNYMSPRLKQSEQEVNQLNAFALQSVYVVSKGATLEEALQHNEKVVARLNELAEQKIVRKYSGLASVLVSDSLQRLRILKWNAYWTPARKQQLLENLKREGAAIGFSPKAIEPAAQMLEKPFTMMDDSVALAMSSSLVESYVIRQPGVVKVLTMVKTSPEHKEDIFKAFDHTDNVSVLDMQYVTGRLVDMVRNDFNSISWMVAAIVFVVLLISFGRIELALIAFIPMFITWIWILGIMGLTGIKFNIVNIIISALIFGLGDDYSLFTLDGLLQEYKTGKKNSSSFRSSIFLSAVTTVAGLGVLIFAKHPSLKSIALIAITGILCVVLISQVLIPVLFRALITNRTGKGQPPFTLWSLFKSVFAFFYFVLGSLLLTVIGFVLVKLNPFAKEKSKYIFHWFISKLARSMMYIMGNVKKKIINPGNEQFKEPAVIVSNHQSFLDILSLIMLHPKIILLTNDWVWNSPVFGFVVRMADYYPVAKGVETSVEKLADRMKQGYSIAVFPEGTRSYDGTMKRFHKGAFYLAEQLQADILPILLHGTGYTMSKGDFMLKDGTITIEYLPRVKAPDTTYGNGYAERTKRISRAFKQAYQQRRGQYEHTHWFREQLISGYLYKGPVLEWYMRIKTLLEKDYDRFDQLVSRQGRVLDIGCGYGFMTYMLHFAGPDRDITGLDYDEEKIATANHCYTRNDKIRFVQGDVLTFHFEQYDTILVCDMLHYLPPALQEQVILTCMQHLHPGGRLIIREGNSEIKDRHTGTRLTEFFSTKVFGFNKTREEGLSFMSGSTIRGLAGANGFGCEEIDDSSRTSNIIFVLDKKEGMHAD